jgi:hypothetical protein
MCDVGSIERRDVLGRIIGDYYRDTADTALALG